MDLTKGKTGILIFKFTVPMLIGNILHQMYNVIDSIIVGHFIGDEALAAVGASFPILFVLLSLVIGLATGGTIIISQYFGAKNFEKLKLSIDTIYFVIFISSIFISIFGIYYSENIFELIDLPKNIIPQAKTYLDIILFGLVTSFGFYGTNAILRGLGDSKTPLYFQIIATFVNIFLDFLFVVYFDFGISGVAYATIIAQGGAFFTAVIYLNKYNKLLKISFFNLKFDKKIFKNILKVGLPSGFQNMFVAVGMMALYKIVNVFGINVIAAYSVVGRIDSFAIIPAMNFSQAFTTFVGQNIGAKKIHRVKKGLISTLMMSSIVSIIFTIVFVFFGTEVMKMFTKSDEVIKIGNTYLQIVSPFYIAFSIMFSFNAVFRGSGDTIVPLFITLFALWFVRVPSSYFLSIEFGETGIWWGIPIAWVVAGLLSFFYYLNGRWKKKNAMNN